MNMDKTKFSRLESKDKAQTWFIIQRLKCVIRAYFNRETVIKLSVEVKDSKF